MSNKFIEALIVVVISLLTLQRQSHCLKNPSSKGALNYSASLADNFSSFEETLNYFHVPGLQYRLNLTVNPLSYAIRMRPVLDDGYANLERFTAPSSVLIKVESIISGSSNIIVMHQKGLIIQEDQVKVTNLGSGQILTILSQTYQPDKDFYILELQESFELGDQLEIFIPYTAKLSLTENVGIYLGHYKDPETNETRYLSTTKLEPYHARKVFPLFDEPSLKATYKISIARVDGKYHSLSNMEIINTEPDVEYTGWVWDHYEETVLMSSYLVCMIVSDFGNETVQIPDTNRTVATWALKHDIGLDGGVYGAETGAKLLEYYEDKYKMPYALRKLDAVALPQFAAGAMENFGLVTYRYNYLVWIPGEGTEAERRKVTQVLAHEIVHQWFGNIVTCAWWSEIWLNEGFARYFQFWGMNATIPEFRVIEAFVNEATQLAMAFDQGPLTHPVKNSAESPEESSAAFDRVSYEKGASLLSMIEGFLTRPVFEAGIIDVYLQKMKWKSAFQDDLFQAIQEAVEMQNATHLLPFETTIPVVMTEWTLTSGFPLVRVDVYDQKRIYISQEKFMTNSKASRKAEGTWWIPVKVVSSANPTYANKVPDLWIPNNVSTLIYSGNELDTSKWIMINPDATGYYRVLYDSKLTELLGQQLLNDHSVISSSSRSQLFDDYFNLASAHYISIETTLELTRYLQYESSSNVWTAVLTHLKPILNKFTQKSGALEGFRKYFLPLFQGTLTIIGDRQATGERGINVILRAQLLDMACQLSMPSCVEYANELIAEWKRNSQINPFPVDLQSSLYCAAIAESTISNDWDFILQKFQDARNDAQKTLLLHALACSRNSTILTRLLDMSLNYLEQYTSAILTRIAMNPEGRSLVYAFVKDNLISNGISPSIFASTVTTLSGYWNEPANIQELQQFIDSNGNVLEPVKTSLMSALQSIQTGIDWWNGFGYRIQSWLEAQ